MAASGTLTPTSNVSPGSVPSKIIKHTLAWTSAASGGTVAQTTAGVISGILLAVEFVPGSPAPTDAYDVTLTDEQGVDILAGQGANQSATVPAIVSPGIALKDGTTTSVIPRPLNDALGLQITNAGNSKAGSIILYVKPQ